MKTLRTNLLICCFILIGFISVHAQSGLTSQPNDSNKVYGGGYTEIQLQPKFPGDINKYLVDSIRYPEEAKKKNIQGIVYVSFVIEKNGSISTVKVLRSDNENLNNEAKRLISAMPNWRPAIKDGHPVRMQALLKVVFKL